MALTQIRIWLSYLILVCLFVPLITSCESRKTVVNALSEKEANEILVFLDTKGIDAIKIKSGEGGGAGSKEVLWDISVNEAEAREAMSILNQAGLPRRRGQNLLGIFGEVGLVPSELHEKIRYQAGLAEQIASTIRKIDGVLDAEVQISFPEEDPLNPGKTKGDITSSVYVKHSGVLDDPNSLLLTKIKRLVTASVTGLKYDNVTVIPDRARYTDFPVGLQASREEEKDYVKVWSVVIAKSSLTRFRAIFFIFTLTILFFLLTLVWIGWKIFPIIKEHGGLAALFSLAPLAIEPPAPPQPEEIESEVEEEEEKVDEERPPTDVT